MIQKYEVQKMSDNTINSKLRELRNELNKPDMSVESLYDIYGSNPPINFLDESSCPDNPIFKTKDRILNEILLELY